MKIALFNYRSVMGFRLSSCSFLQRFPLNKKKSSSPIHIFDLEVQTTFNKSSDISLASNLSSKPNLWRLSSRKTIIELDIGFVPCSSLSCYQTFISLAAAQKDSQSEPENTKTFCLLVSLAVIFVCGCWNNENILCFSISFPEKRVLVCWQPGASLLCRCTHNQIMNLQHRTSIPLPASIYHGIYYQSCDRWVLTKWFIFLLVSKCFVIR